MPGGTSQTVSMDGGEMTHFLNQSVNVAWSNTALVHRKAALAQGKMRAYPIRAAA